MKAKCLLPSTLDELQDELKHQGITLQKFFLDESISPEQRQKILESALGSKENADFFTQQVYDNIITPLLERQTAKALEKEQLKANIVEDIVLNRIRRLQGKMSPQYEDMYLENLVQRDLKLAVSQQQAEELVSAQASVDAALEDMNNAIKKSGKFGDVSYKDIYKESDVDKIHEDQELEDKYVRLGLAIVKYSDTYAEISQDVLSKASGALLKKIVGSTRTAILSGDLSFGRNISNMFFVNPKIGWKAWSRGVSRFFGDLWYGNEKDANGFTKKDYAWANIYAHPNVISGRLKSLGVNIGITEEQFLNSGLAELTEKAEDVSREGKGALKSLAYITRPLHRLYSASEDSFNLAVNMARFMYGNAMLDLYDAKTNKDAKLLKDNGVGDLIMLQTGRWNAQVGKDVIDMASFYIMALRWTASRVSTAKNLMYAPAALVDIAKKTTGKGGIKSLDAFYLRKTNVDKGRSALGLVVFMPIAAALLSAAFSEDDDKDYWEKVLQGLDPTEDYGKIVIGKTRFDLTGGIAPVVKTVAKTAKLLWEPQHGKNAWDPLARFVINRQAPIVSVIYGMAEHLRATFDETYLPTDIMGDPETFEHFLRGMLLPIYIDNTIEYITGPDDEIGTIEAIAAVVADVFGIGAATYSERASKAEILEQWGKASPLVKISSRSNLATKLSKEEFIEVEKEMERIYMEEARRLMSSSNFKNMSREQKDAELTKLHRNIVDRLSRGRGVASKSKKKYGLKK